MKNCSNPKHESIWFSITIPMKLKNTLEKNVTEQFIISSSSLLDGVTFLSFSKIGEIG